MYASKNKNCDWMRSVLDNITQYKYTTPQDKENLITNVSVVYTSRDRGGLSYLL